MATEKDIGIENIEVELKKLRNKEKEHGHACLFNVVVFLKDIKKVKYIKKIVDGIVAKFPCRIIFIQCNPNENESFLTINVSSETSAGGISCDQISIEVSPSELKRIPFIVIPHLVPDLPIYLFWGQDPTEDQEILPSLIPYAKRLIFDIEMDNSYPSYCKKILQFMQKHSHLEFTDISWSLLTGWRKAFALIFDTPASVERLNRNNGIQIHYNEVKNDRKGELQAIYLFGRLAARMSWKVLESKKKEATYTFLCTNGKDQFTITVCPHKQSDNFSPGVIAFDISTIDNFFYSISPVPDTSKVIVHISTIETCQLPFSLSVPSLKHEFPYALELFLGETNIHYREMLETLSKNVLR